MCLGSRYNCRTRYITVSIFLTVCSSTSTRAAQPASTYYVDCRSGNDAADGLSPSAAWKSVGKVSDHRFFPGDSIAFRRGSVCSGMLWPKGSGSGVAPIRIDAWGTGPLPNIQAIAGDEAAFRLSNQEYWSVDHVDFSGGQPHGVFIDGTSGVLHGIHLSDLVVHDVTGKPKTKEGGLVVIAPGSGEQKFDDVVVDGVTAYHTSQWAGILVGGVRFGVLPVSARSTNVIVRNSIVHDLAGDGIVLFQVNNGVIENSVAWHTGMQETETIGTPSAIWTWMCADCAMRRNEAFLTDSPGVDGGAFDIDYSNTNNIVEGCYGHDTQGYCASIFGAGQVTANSTIKNNICADNGRSPRLAQRQGAIFLSTWNNGKLKGVHISGNRIFWAPPLATAAVVNTADFDGAGVFEKNTIESSSPFLIRSNSSLVFDNNSYNHPTNRVATTRDVSPGKEIPALSFRDAEGKPVPSGRLPHKWVLLAFVSTAPADHDSRGQVAIIESAQRQFHSAGLEVIIIPAQVADEEHARNLQYDWNLGAIRLLFDDGSAARALNVLHMPALVLVNPGRKIVWHHDGFTLPGELGLKLRSFLGRPDYAQMSPE